MFINGIRVKVGVFGRGQRVGRCVVGGFLDGFISGFGVVKCMAFRLDRVLQHKKSQGHIDDDLKN